MSSFVNFSYKELQKAAREIGIKPQQKKEKLVKLLTAAAAESTSDAAASAAAAGDGDDYGGPNSDYVTAREVRDLTPADFMLAVQKEYFAVHSVYGPCILDFEGSKTCPVGSISIRYGVDGAKQMVTKNVTISHVAINMTGGRGGDGGDVAAPEPEPKRRRVVTDLTGGEDDATVDPPPTAAAAAAAPAQQPAAAAAPAAAQPAAAAAPTAAQRPSVAAAPAAVQPLALRGRKVGNKLLREQVAKRDGAAGRFIFSCVHCEVDVQTAKVLNTSRLLKHVCECSKCPGDIKVACRRKSQLHQHQQNVVDLVGGGQGRESIESMRANGRHLGIVVSGGFQSQASAATSRSSSGGSGSGSSSSNSFDSVPRGGPLSTWGHMCSPSEANKLIRVEAEAIVARFEPLTRIEDPFVIRAILLKSPGLEKCVAPNTIMCTPSLPHHTPSPTDVSLHSHRVNLQVLPDRRGHAVLEVRPQD
jgi:hypothetical protein